MKIKSLFSLALLAAINYCAHAQFSTSGWITTGSGTGGSSSVAGTNYSASMTLMQESSIALTNTVYRSLTNYDVLVSPNGGFLASQAAGTFSISNAGNYLVQVKLGIKPFAASDTNKPCYLAIITNGVAAASTVVQFNSPVDVNSIDTVMSSQILTLGVGDIVAAGMQTTGTTNSQKTYGISFIIQGLTAGGSGSSGNGDISATSSNNILSAAYAAANPPAWGLFGVAFNGGQVGWPPTGVEEAGKFVYSPDGVNWVGGLGQPQLQGPTGAMRDPALARISDGLYMLAITSSQSTNHTTNASYCISSNLMHYGAWSNLSFKLTGETYTFASNYVWSPVITVIGSTVAMNVSVSTNNGLSFHQRYITSTTNDYHNWSTPAVMNNQTGRTNIIDLTPFMGDDGILYAWYKNEATAYMELARFDSVDISSAFRPVLTNDHSGWSSAIEGNWMVKTPANKYRVYGVRYVNQAGGYGNNGQGQQLFYAESSSITNGWSAMTNANTPFYIQSFKPLVIRNMKEQNNAVAASFGNNQLRGIVNVEGRYGSALSGLKFRGLAFTNPFPAAQPTGMVSNDFAAINFGTEGSSAGGIYARGDGTVRIYVPTYVYGNSNIVIGSYVQDSVIFKSNTVTFVGQMIGDGSGLTGITASAPGGSGTSVTHLKPCPDYTVGIIASGGNNLTNVVNVPSVGMPGFFLVAGGAGNIFHNLAPKSMTGYKTNITTYAFASTNSTSGSFYHTLLLANEGTLSTTNSYITLKSFSMTNAGIFTLTFTNTTVTPWTEAAGWSKLYENSVPTNIWLLGGMSAFY